MIGNRKKMKLEAGISNLDIRHSKRPGFTLLEMLIVVFIFSIVSAILVQTFVSFNRQHRKIANLSVLAQDMRFMTEMFVRLARSNKIDYSGAPLADELDQIRFITPDGGVTLALRQNPDCGDAKVTNCLAMKRDADVTWSVVSSKRVNVNRLSFFVRPANDPFADTSLNYQPIVTLLIGLDFVADSPREYSKLDAQTTVSSRLYQR